MRAFFITFILFILSAFIYAQNEGIPLIRNYLPEEYHGYFQNWCAEQDNRGVMYFGNGKGILEYNGKNWRRFFTEKFSTVLSMGKDSLGRIYVGGEGEIGYLGTDSTGLVVFKSLENQIPEAERDFHYVWHIYSNKKSVYFVTPEKVMKLTNNHFSFYKPKRSYFTAFMVNNRFFIQDTDLGLLTEENDSLVQFDGWNELGDLRAIFPLPDDNYIGISGSEGLINFGKNKLPQIVPSELDKYISLKFYKGVALPDGNYALGTTVGGVIIFNPKGQIKQIIDADNGLAGSSVYALFVDSQKELWVMLSNGLSRINVSTPFTFFNDKNGITGIVQDIEKLNGKLYVATLEGLFELNIAQFDSHFSPAHFSVTNNMRTQVYTLTVNDNKLLVANLNGIYEINGNVNQYVFHDQYEICIENSKYHPNLAFLGGSSKFRFLRKENNAWKIEHPVEGITGDIYYITEQNKNTIWAGTVADGIYKIQIIDTLNLKAKVNHYDTLKGVPAGMTEVRFVNGKILAGTNNGLFYYNEKADSFEKAGFYGTLIEEDEKPCFVLSAGADSSLWFMREKTIVNLQNTKTGFIPFETPFFRLKFNDLYNIFPDSNNIIWFGTTDGIIRYKANDAKDFNAGFYTLINKVVYYKDTLFNGCNLDSSGYFTTIQASGEIKTLKYSHNTLAFEFSATSFDDEAFNQFSYFLDGFDEDWSDWSVVNKKEYTNIPEGEYVFKVKSKNIYGVEGIEATYSFVVLPPWYRTVLAYIVYFVVLVLLIYVAIRINSRRLRAANIRLEKIVAERTEDLRRRNEEIMQQKEEITAQRDEIEVQRDRLVLLNEEIQQQKEEIEAQRDEIEVQRDKIVIQNKEITDSIQYAKIIQTAVMPPVSMLELFFPESFILFRPKDIVSGDFYWFYKKHNTILIAAVDCTGHGVPGGFMSMLGNALLNEIMNKLVDEQNIEASFVLNELRKLVINSLHQSGRQGEQKDGMDISLIAINTTPQAQTSEGFKPSEVLCAYTAQWAGANNPLYVIARNEITKQSISGITSPSVRNDEIELHELKGDKMPIGIYYGEEKEFTNHKLTLQKGERLYLFSDGFADQFGGINGKKLKYNKMKELFVSGIEQSMKEQRIAFEKYFDEWLNPSDLSEHYEQIDDVLIIGIEIT